MLGRTTVDPIGPLLALGSLFLYSRTVAPSLGGTIDSAEFQQASYSLSIAHPTGYPLYLLLSRIWISIYPFGGDPAYRVNLLSALFGALAVWVLYLSVKQVTQSRVAGASAAALFAVQAVAWAEASVAEINSFNTLLTGLAFLAVIKWAWGEWPLPAAMLAYGLAASHHRTAVLYAPLLFLFSVWALRRGLVRVTKWGLLVGALLFVLPFAAYIYLPLRAAVSPDYSNNWQGFWSVVLGESALPVITGALGRPLLPRFGSLLFGPIFYGWTGYILLLLGCLGGAGFVVGWQRHGEASPDKQERGTGDALWRASTLLFVAAFATGITFAALYDIIDITDYLGVPVYMWCVVTGLGIGWVLTTAIRMAFVRDMALAGALRSTLLFAILALALITASKSLARPDMRVDFSGLDVRLFWRQVQASSAAVPAQSIFIGDWPEVNQGRYLQHVEGWRPDIHLVVLDSLGHGDLPPVARWLSEKQPVYLLGPYEPVFRVYTVHPEGALGHVISTKAASPNPPMQYTLNRRFPDNITLLGYTLDPKPPLLVPGGLLTLTLYWKAEGAVIGRYVTFNHIIDAAGRKIAFKDGEPDGGLKPTLDWKPGETVVDTFILQISPDAAPGHYRLMSGLYPRLGDSRLPATSADGKSLGDYPELQEITVK
ncbi:MAG: DUF2723 domain-containing protein [Chloroflexota bacterium]|nr:DUF2723 domain-containing protein [Chloroflexota bacterium]